MMTNRTSAEDGFSLTELLISLLVLLSVSSAAFSLFSVATGQHNTERSAAEMNQEARSALETIMMEVSQAGSHADFTTTASAPILAQVNAQAVPVASSTGFPVGDYIDIDPGLNNETVQVTAVGTNSVSAVFRIAHATGVPVVLFAQPYLTGVVPPAGLGANSSATSTTLKF